MRILLLGGNGQLGTALQDRLPALGEVVVATRAECDLSQPSGVAAFVQSVKPDVIVNAAAYTAVDLAETEAEQAHAANGESAGELGGAAKDLNALLLHYSTDYVFDGNGERPYLEDDPVSPANAYGASKLAGEQAIRDSGCRHLILRTAWVYGPTGKNFFLTILRLAAEREELGIVGDQTGCPTSTLWLAEATASILSGPASLDETLQATVHAVCAGQCSWFDFASAIVDGAKVRGETFACRKIKPITTADYPTPAARPAYSVLDTTRLREMFGITPLSWRDALDEVLDRKFGPSPA
ncbi:MAG: dTDP-4-dehydrorhamnose reductase [Alphaproteobacteria bacterium]